MTRIALGAADMGPGRGGIARLARLTALSLLRRGVELKVLSFLDNEKSSIEATPIVPLAGSKIAFLTKCYLASLDCTHFFYDSVGVARAHPRLFRYARPYGLWMNGIEVWEGIRTSSRHTLRHASLPIANSQYTLDRYRQLHGHLPQAHVCRLGTDTDDEGPDLTHIDGPPTVLILSRISLDEQYKGHEELIKVWPVVREAVPDARLIIAGGGDGLDHVRRAAASSRAASSIEVTGFIPEASIDSIWSRASIFAMPSRGEGFGFVYIEAMRRGLPVIASTHDAGREVNLDGISGFNVDLDEAGHLEDRLIALLKDEELRIKMGSAGRELWRREYSFSAFHRRFSTLMERSFL